MTCEAEDSYNHLHRLWQLSRAACCPACGPMCSTQVGLERHELRLRTHRITTCTDLCGLSCAPCCSLLPNVLQHRWGWKAMSCEAEDTYKHLHRVFGLSSAPCCQSCIQKMAGCKQQVLARCHPWLPPP